MNDKTKEIIYLLKECNITFKSTGTHNVSGYYLIGDLEQELSNDTKVRHDEPICVTCGKNGVHAHLMNDKIKEILEDLINDEVIKYTTIPSHVVRGYVNEIEKELSNEDNDVDTEQYTFEEREKELSKDSEILDWIIENPLKAIKLLKTIYHKDDFRDLTKQAMKES